MSTFPKDVQIDCSVSGLKQSEQSVVHTVLSALNFYPDMENQSYSEVRSLSNL